MRYIIEVLIKLFKSFFIKESDSEPVDISIYPSDTFKIEMLYPPLRPLAVELLQEAKKAGLKVGVFESFRSLERQRDLYAIGRTSKIGSQPVTNSITSWHNFGLAIDVVFNQGGWSWANTNKWNVLREIGLRAGWQTVGEWDKPHFQITFNQDRAILKEIYNRHGNIREVWDHIDKQIGRN